jgi:hypothetical protein
MNESGQNASESLAQKVKRGLASLSGDFGYSITGVGTRIQFSPHGDCLTITFDDHSTLRIERQDHSHYGLAARVVQEPEPGRIPAPWEDV